MFDLPESDYYTTTAEELLTRLESNAKTGLSSEAANKRQQEYGLNELEEEPPTPLWKLVLEQFDDILVKILLVSALISFVLAYFENNGSTSLSDYVEPLVILLILIMNAIVGVWQENNAESALQALKKMQSETARCYRDGELINNLPAKNLVPGDIILVFVRFCHVYECRFVLATKFPQIVVYCP